MVLRTLFALSGCLAGVSFAIAQSPQISAGTSVSGDAPQATIVEVQQQPAQVIDRTKVYEAPTRMDRAERRAYKAKQYAQKVDSLVQSRNYMFFPNSMQQTPGGLIRYVYADYFYFGLFVDHVQVHLPIERGFSQYVGMLNFDSESVRDYRSSHQPWGWNISFDIADGQTLYHADMEVSTVTGETILTLVGQNHTMRYVGWLWNKRVNDPKDHDMSW